MSRPRKRRRRIFYVAPLALDPRHRHLESPAARNKVLGVASALRAGGGMPIVVTSAGRLRTSLGQPLRVHRQGGTCFIEAFSVGGGLGRRLSSLFSLAWFALRLVRRDDRILLYNSYPDLLLLALVQRLRRSPCVLDLEDAPRQDDAGSLGRLINRVFPLFRRWCARRMVVASSVLARQNGIDEFLPVYGVASFFRSQVRAYSRFSGAAVRILFGGTLVRDTGIDLFADALRLLARMPLARPLEFVVTGKFAAGAFADLEEALAPCPDLSLSIVRDLDTASYAALIATMDVGLCLKLASSDTGQSTFPSKVVEIAALGLLLVSTRVSDVPLLFDETRAVLLESENPLELAERLAGIAADPAQARARSMRGQRFVQERLSAQHVGAELMAFLDTALAQA